MIRYVGLISPVMQLMHPRRIPGPPQDAVTPRRPFECRSYLYVSANVMGPSENPRQTGAVELDLAQKLIVSQEVRKLPGPD